MAQAVKPRRKIVEVSLLEFRLRCARGVQPSVPYNDVKPFDLLDQHEDRFARSCYFSARIGLESFRPLA